MNNEIENLYKKGQNESSPLSLDNSILNIAKESCNTSQVINTRSRKWLYSLSTAAVVVLSFSVIFNLQHENEQIIIPAFIDSPDNSSKKKSKPGLMQNVNKTKAPLAMNTKEEKVHQNFSESSDKYFLDDSKKRKVEFENIQPTTNRLNDSEKIDSVIQPQAEVSSLSELRSEEMTGSISESSHLIIIPEETPQVSQPEKNTDIDANAGLEIQKSSKPIPVNKNNSRLKSRNEMAETIQPLTKPVVKFSQKITILEQLIKDKRLVQAKEFLQQLMKSYPDNDFSKYIKILES
jgi:hypothetical protein